jgi:hypothetical protein
MPPPGNDLAGYTLNVNSIVPAQCDDDGNVFAFTVTASYLGGTVRCYGYTDFPINTVGGVPPGAKLRDVVLYRSRTQQCFSIFDCEKEKLQAAIQRARRSISNTARQRKTVW